MNMTQVDLILDYLGKVKGETVSEIARALGLNANYVTNALWRMQTQDLVWKEPGKKSKTGIYHLTEKEALTVSISDTNDIASPLDGMQMVGSQDAHIASLMKELEG